MADEADKIGRVARALAGEDGDCGAAAPDDSFAAGGDPIDDLGPSELRAVDPSIDLAVVQACAALDHSDTDNARRLIAHFGADLVVVAQEGFSGGDWAGWTGQHWDLAGGAALSARICQKLGGAIALEAEYIQPTPAEAADIKEGRRYTKGDKSVEAGLARAKKAAAEKSWKARKASRWRFAVTSKNAGRMRSTLDCAAPHLRKPADGFNADPYLVACASHTLAFVKDGPDPDTDGKTDLWAINAIPGHRRSDFITALVPHGWNPAAPAPRWLAFLARMLPDDAVRRTVRAYCGASLLNVPLQRIMFHYGAGANGKSVFLETLTQVLGESFAIGLPPESIAGDSARGAGAASPDIARLFGKRMVRVLELPEGKPLHEDLVKRLTGGEKFPVRSLFKGYFEFVNRAKPHMSGNGFPTIDGTDHGIWRRMLVVHWGVTIPEADRREFEAVVAEFVAEAEGILAWLAKGAVDFLTHGLPIAPAIAAATEKYREDMDPIGQFFSQCLRAAPGKAEKARTVYQAYVSWSMANSKRVRTETKFGREGPKHYPRAMRAGVQTYLDCELHDVPDRPDAAAARSSEFYPEGYGA